MRLVFRRCERGKKHFVFIQKIEKINVMNRKRERYVKRSEKAVTNYAKVWPKIYKEAYQEHG